MSNIGGQRALYSAQSQFRTAWDAENRVAVERCGGIIALNTDATGGVPLSRLSAVQRACGDVIQRLFVGDDLRSAYRDTSVPQSPFARLLNRYVAKVTYDVLKSQQRFMNRVVPETLKGWLLISVAQEQVRSNPLAHYDPLHTWVDPRGYTLSDRIWQNSLHVRMRIDAYLTDAIRNGVGSLTMQADLQRFLLPSMVGLRTDKPYGRDVSYYAMRLARTEIARAHAQASQTASLANPYVAGLDWALSARHPKFDICDGLATIGMAGQRLREPYPVESAPLPVSASHPQCLCHVRPAVVSNLAEVTRELMSMYQSGAPAPLTPFNLRTMLSAMLGTYVASEFLAGINS